MPNTIPSELDTPELTSVREAHRIDEARLAEYLADHLPQLKGELLLRQFEGGQSNPTYLPCSSGFSCIQKPTECPWRSGFSHCEKRPLHAS